MFRSFTRLPLRRCLHTVPPKALPPAQGSSLSLILGLGATVGAVAYFSNSGGRRLALDTPSGMSYNTHTPSHSSAPKTASAPELEHADPSDPSEGGFAALAEGEEGSGEGSGGQGGAFNPETGEINWDCPCLGGMAHGVCGPQFREAFSCFVFSEQEPKGIDCVEKFKGMQDCFREHPDIYGEEIMDDDDEEADAPAGSESDAPPPVEASEDSAISTEQAEGTVPQTQSA